MSHRPPSNFRRTLSDWRHRASRHLRGQPQVQGYDYNDTTPEELEELAAAATGAQPASNLGDVAPHPTNYGEVARLPISHQKDMALTEPSDLGGESQRPVADQSHADTRWPLREFLQDSTTQHQDSPSINPSCRSRLTWDNPLVLRAQIQSAGRTIESYRHKLPDNLDDIGRFTDFCSSLYGRKFRTEFTGNGPYIPSEQLLHELINATTDDYHLTSALQDIRSYLYEDVQSSNDGDEVPNSWQIEDLRAKLKRIIPASPVSKKTIGEINAEKWSKELESSKSLE